MDEINLKDGGIKGWLLLLCISLTMLDPCSILFNLLFVVNVVKPYFEQNPELLQLILINGTCSIALAVFSIYAGISLWKILPNAVVLARRYFACIFLYSIFSVFLPTLVGIPENTPHKVFGNNLFNSLITILYASAWYLYLKKSRRVKAVYKTTVTDQNIP